MHKKQKQKANTSWSVSQRLYSILWAIVNLLKSLH